MRKKKYPMVRKVLYDYGKRMGYDASSFPNKILAMVSKLRKDGIVIEDVVGIRKFGGRWYAIDKYRLQSWLGQNIKPGPKFGLRSIPEDIDQPSFLREAEGIYNLRAVLEFLETEVVDFYKVRNAAKRVEKERGDARREIGAFIKNDVWVVEFPKFGAYLCENEPKIWNHHQRLLVGKQAE